MVYFLDRIIQIKIFQSSLINPPHRFGPPHRGHCAQQQHVSPSRVSYHVLHSAQILGTLGVAVVLSQVCCCEAVLVLDAQVHPIDHKDLTALGSETDRQ